MAFCSNCGFNLPENVAFCPKCGTPAPAKASAPVVESPVELTKPEPAAEPAPVVEPAPAPVVEPVPVQAAPVQPTPVQPAPFQAAAPAYAPYQPTYAPNAQPYVSSTNATGFVSPDEKVLYGLKNGLALNMLSGEGFRSEDAVITDKRLYYNHKDGIINISKSENIVDLKDITGVKITEIKALGLIIAAIVIAIAGFIIGATAHELLASIPFITMGLIFVAAFFITRKAFLAIEYAGGVIRFSVKKYGMAKVREFQRQIFAIRDKVQNK